MGSPVSLCLFFLFNLFSQADTCEKDDYHGRLVKGGHGAYLKKNESNRMRKDLCSGVFFFGSTTT
jgi:hypothetical protein